MLSASAKLRDLIFHPRPKALLHCTPSPRASFRYLPPQSQLATSYYICIDCGIALQFTCGSLSASAPAQLHSRYKRFLLTIFPQAALPEDSNSESEGDIAPAPPKTAQNGMDDDEEDDEEEEGEELSVALS